MLKSVNLSSEQLKSLKNGLSLGMDGAAQALSDMLGKKINVDTPNVKFIPIQDVPDTMGGPEQGVVSVYIAIEGEVSGHIMLILHLQSAFNLVDILMELDNGSTVELDEMGMSALEEVGNITGSFFLSALGDYTKTEMRPSPPSCVVDMAAALLSSVLADVSRAAEQVLVMETVFSISSKLVRGFFFLFPEPESLNKLLKSIEAAG